MGWFDPPHVNILAKSPQGFQQLFMVFGPLLEAMMIEDRRTLRGSGIHFRAAVIGRVALLSNNAQPGFWSADAIRYVHKQLKISDHMLGPEMVSVAISFADLVAYGKKGRPDNSSCPHCSRAPEANTAMEHSF
jgi:hypothetical protein